MEDEHNRLLGDEQNFDRVLTQLVLEEVEATDIAASADEFEVLR